MDLYKTDNHRWSLTDFEPKWEPSLPMFKNIKIKGNKFILEWEKSHDKDNDRLPSLFVRKSRGWNYKEVEAPDNVKKYFFGIGTLKCMTTFLKNHPVTLV